jgi:hypothetical protein
MDKYNRSKIDRIDQRGEIEKRDEIDNELKTNPSSKS